MDRKEKLIIPTNETFREVVNSVPSNVLSDRGKPIPVATHKGNFEKEFGIDIDCYVLNDPIHTAVIHQRGMSETLGLKSTSGVAFKRFIEGKNISVILGQELVEKLSKPLIFKVFPLGQENVEVKAHGYDITILIDICKALLNASETGSDINPNVIKQAQVIINASAKFGIKELAYTIAGYESTKEERIQAYKFYVREEAREYEKEFPDQLYEEWYRIYELSRPIRNRPWKFKHLTMKQIYYPLAKSSGNISDLVKIAKMKSGKPKNTRLHQFLSEVGVKALRQHLGQLLAIAQLSKTINQYEKNFNKIFGEQMEFDFTEDN